MEDKTKVKKIITKNSLNDFKSQLDNNQSNHFVYIPTMNKEPNASVNYLFDFANALKKHGKNVVVIHNEDYELPFWVDRKITEGLNRKYQLDMKIKATDFLYIPEGLVSAFFESLNGKRLPCEVVVIAQIKATILRPLKIGEAWTHYGIRNVLTTSKMMKSHIESLFALNVGVASPHIPSYFDCETPQLKKPMVVVASRDKGAGNEIIKRFYLRYPTLRWINFTTAQGMSRRAYADVLKDAAVVLWNDDQSTFGTVPLEAMRSKSIVIGKYPDFGCDWMYEKDSDGKPKLVNSMLFCNTVNEMDTKLAEVLNNYLTGRYNKSLYNAMDETVSSYTIEAFEKAVGDYVKYLIEDRKSYIEQKLELQKNNQ